MGSCRSRPSSSSREARSRISSWGMPRRRSWLRRSTFFSRGSMPPLRSRLRTAIRCAPLALLLVAGSPRPADAQKIPTIPPSQGVRVGQRLIDFTLPDLDGRTRSLKELRGRSVVQVTFWATWCVPCMQEIPQIRQIYDRYRPQGFEVLSIALNLRETPDGVRAIARDFKIDYPILWDGDGALMKRFNISMVPQNFLIGKDGIIRYTG